MTYQFEKEKMTLLSEEGSVMGWIKHPQIKPGIINIESVFTDPQFRGQGLAGQMMKALLEHLRKNEGKAVLTCPYAQRYVGEHPEYSDLLANVKFSKI